MVNISTTIFLGVALAIAVGGQAMAETPAKIHFDLDRLDENGLYGPPDAKRSLSYEFCVPNEADLLAQVQIIDPSLTLYPQSRGRVGCGEDEVLAIGNTHQPHYRDVLLTLASIDEIECIVEFFGE